MGGNRWTPEEDEIIKAHYATEPMRKMLDRLPGRNWISIKSRGYRLGVRRVIPESFTREKKPRKTVNLPPVCDWMEEHMDRVGVADERDRRNLYKERAQGDCQFNRCCKHATAECMTNRPLPQIHDYGKEANCPKTGGMMPGYRFNTSIHNL